MRTPLAVTVIASIAVLVGLLLYPALPSRDPRVLSRNSVDETVAYSNILPDDYVGPVTCAECHQDQYNLWKKRPHHCMNQLPNAESVKGDFDNARLELTTGVVDFTTDDDGRYWMTIEKNGEVYRTYRVTRTVGSKYMQYYIGKQVTGPEPPEHDIYREHMLPFAYPFQLKRWYPRQFFDKDGPEILKDGVP